jgi:CHAT domain-containing protein/Tfp pilus assembly protein PilF
MIRLRQIVLVAICAILSNAEENIRLLPNTSYSGALIGQQEIQLVLRIEAGQAAHLLLQQFGNDLAVKIQSPGNSPAWTIDGFDNGTESISILATATGDYGIRISNVTGTGQAQFEIKWSSLGIATEADNLRSTAEVASTKAKQAEAGAEVGRDTAALRAAIESRRNSAHLWEQVHDALAVGQSFLAAGNDSFEMGNIAGARRDFHAARESCIQIGDLRCAALSGNNEGLCAWQMGDLESALDQLSGALKIWQQLGVRQEIATTSNNLGLLAAREGDWPLALKNYQQAAEIFRGSNRRGEGLVLNNIGIVYLDWGDPNNAARYFARAVKVLHEVHDRSAEGKALMNSGRACMMAGNLDRAIAKHHRALALLDRPTDQRFLGDVWNNLGQVQLRAGHLSLALPALNTALRIYRKFGDKRGEASALHYRGVASARRHPQAAMLDLQGALQIRREIGITNDIGETLFQLARVSQKSRDVVQALKYAEEAVLIANSQRARVLGTQAQEQFFAAKQQYFHLYADILFKAEPGEEAARRALDVVELSRARTLTETLMEDRDSHLLFQDDPVLVEKGERVKRRLRFLALQSAGASSAGLVQAKAGQIDSLLGEYREVEGQLNASNPRHALWSAPSLLNSQNIQADFLDDETTLLVYSLSEPSSHLWIVRRHELRHVFLAGRGQIERLASRVLTSLTQYGKRHEEPAAEQAFRESTKQLSCILLGPVKNLKARIAIAAEGILQSVSFPALQPGCSDLQQLPLGLTAEIVRIPSASSVAMVRHLGATRTRAPRSLAVFADPVFSLDDPRATRPGETHSQAAASLNMSTLLAHYRDGYFSRLAFSHEEAQILRHLDPDALILTGFNATRLAFAASSLSEFRIIHFATHAVTDDRHPETSGIVLSLVDRMGRPQDGFLRLFDIYQMVHLKADLVVLSACKTAGGRDLPGEGVISLARGFLFAGVPAVIASQWKVDDEATSVFMRYFYNSLLSPKSPTPVTSVRAARLALFHDPRWQDPYFWAGFEIYGDWQWRKSEDSGSARK